MNNQPLVSIFIPCYNHEKFIVECIGSIFNQTYKNFELLVVDDGSKDNSRKLIEKLAHKHRFKYILQENMGLINTLNTHVPSLHGKYICCLASDDAWHPEKLEKQVEKLETTNAAACFTPHILIDENSNQIGFGPRFNEKTVTFEKLLCYNIISAPSMLMRNQTLKDAGYWSKHKDIFVEDWVMWLKIAKLGEIHYINEYLTYYRITPGSLGGDLIKILKQNQLIRDLYKNHITPKIRNEIDYENTLISIYEKKYFYAFYKYFKNITKRDLFLPNFLNLIKTTIKSILGIHQKRI